MGSWFGTRSRPHGRRNARSSLRGRRSGSNSSGHCQPLARWQVVPTRRLLRQPLPEHRDPVGPKTVGVKCSWHCARRIDSVFQAWLSLFSWRSMTDRRTRIVTDRFCHWDSRSIRCGVGSFQNGTPGADSESAHQQQITPLGQPMNPRTMGWPSTSRRDRRIAACSAISAS
jgi:hypothetical protein